MVLLKTSVALLLVAVAFAAVTPIPEKPKSAEKYVAPPQELKYNTSIPTETNTTSVQPPTEVTTTTTEAPPKPTTSIPTTSTVAPNNVTTTSTTAAPNVTTTSTITPTTSKPSTTTIPPAPTTSGPSTSTVSPTPAPEPTPARSWDGSSFLGGMVLAFGIVAVGFVGYRFFYLGRGGAYHTL